MPGLFDSLPAPSRGAEPPALGKRPSEPSADDSSKKARSDATSESELASASSGGAAVAAAAAGAAAAALHCTALQAAYSEDAGARLTMEDVAVVQYDAGPEAGCRLSFFSVFDGHGGRHVAQYAAEHLNSAVLAAGLQAEAARLAVAAAAGSGEGGPPQPPQPGVKACKAAIVEGFRELDRRVLEQCSAGPGQPGWPDGSTAVAAWVLGDAVLVANVGDARCVLARRPQQAAGEQPAGGGEPQAGSAAQQAVAGAPAGEQAPAAKQAAGGQQQQQQLEPLKAITLTREHKAIFPQERQRIEKAGSFVSSDGRLAGRIEVSRAFGDRQFKRQGMSAVPDIQAFQITPRDAFLLLACDGFWGVFSPQDAVDFAQRELVGKGHGVKQTCNRLIHEAIRQRNCRDNCTVMLIVFGHGG